MVQSEQSNARGGVSDLLLGPAVLRPLPLFFPLVAAVTSTSFLQGGRSLLLGGWVIGQLPTAHLAVVQASLPGTVRLVLDGMVSIQCSFLFDCC